MLYPWTGTRPYGRLLDTGNNYELSSDIVVFDLKGLSSYPDLQSVMILIITDFILGKIESAPGRRKRILMDECWDLLKSQGASQFMEYCARTLRKTGSGITFITQGLEEIERSPIGPAILNNTATKFILLQRGDIEPIRKVLKFNDQEMALISSLKQQKGMYSEAFLIANERRTVVRVVPTPLEYWLSTSDAADQNLLDQARERMKGQDLSLVLLWLAKQFPKGSQGVTQIPDQIEIGANSKEAG
jgi:type IV secretory pathway VirB4 component